MYPRQAGTAAVKPLSSSSATIFSDKRVEEALAAVHRSLATSQFYPPNHPLLLEALRDGHHAWKDVGGDPRMATTGLRLKSGSLWFGDDVVGENNPAVRSLAKTFAAHGLVCVIQRETLTQEGFSRWVELLASSPDCLSPQGGIEGAWKDSPFCAALELRRLAVAPGTRSGGERHDSGEGEWGRGLSETAEIPAIVDSEVLTRLRAFQQRGPRERRVLDLLLRLGRTDHDSAFLQLLKEIAHITQEYVFAERFKEAFHVALFLYREAQNMNALGKDDKRDSLIDTLRLLLRGAFLGWLINFIVAEQGTEEAEVGEYILRAIGKPVVVPLINALVLEKDWRGRKRLVDVLVAVGAPAIPQVVRMLDDQRWFVVRNMVTILGGISTPESLKALSRLVTDSDSRIRREVVRAVTRASGPTAEAILLALLEDTDPAVRLMAVSAAASQRTPEVLEALWGMYRSISIRVPEWNVKAQILQTLGRMGLPDATDHLEAVVAKRPFLWRRRWEIVHATAIQALGELGGRRARGVLEKLLDHRNAAIRRATLRALATCGDGRVAEES